MNEDEDTNTVCFSDTDSIYDDSDTESTESNELINCLNEEKFKIISSDETYNKYIEHVKTTRPYITKFEKTKIIGIRATQIENGDKPLIVVPEQIISSIQIAELELKNRVIPLIIRRKLTNGTFEDWKLNDFINLNN